MICRWVARRLQGALQQFTFEGLELPQAGAAAAEAARGEVREEVVMCCGCSSPRNSAKAKRNSMLKKLSCQLLAHMHACRVGTGPVVSWTSEAPSLKMTVFINGATRHRLPIQYFPRSCKYMFAKPLGDQYFDFKLATWSRQHISARPDHGKLQCMAMMQLAHRIHAEDLRV